MCRILLVALVAVSSAACADSGGATVTTDLLGLGEPPPVPELDGRAVAEAEVLYAAHCAACHRADLSGDPDWMTPNADGSYPPPPHDSTGHTWHHPDPLLAEIIRDGGGFPESRMPGFGEVLSDGQIASVLTYLKSTWGADERGHQWRVTWQEEQLTDR